MSLAESNLLPLIVHPHCALISKKIMTLIVRMYAHKLMQSRERKVGYNKHLQRAEEQTTYDTGKGIFVAVSCPHKSA